MEEAVINLKKGTANEAAKWNGILAKEEVGYETDTGLKKIGDGRTRYNDLRYSPDLSQIKINTLLDEKEKHLALTVDGISLIGTGTREDPLKVSNNVVIGDATETTAGIAKLITYAETIGQVDDTKITTIAKLRYWWDSIGLNEAAAYALSYIDTPNGFAGLSATFQIHFKNLLGTFISLFQNSNTAIRTYTFQNRNGTIADDTDLAGKQATLVSGTNIKTINGSSLLGSGDLTVISGSVPDATETVKGKAELATQVETDAGTDDLRIVTPLKLNTFSKWATKQDVIGYTAESMTNKKTNFDDLSVPDDYYPTLSAIEAEFGRYKRSFLTMGA